LELLFGRVKKHEIDLPETAARADSASAKKTGAVVVDDDEAWGVKRLLVHLRDKLLTERPELFMQGDSVRPGILVLINEVDWELEGRLQYRLKANDHVVFISTLHGG